MSRSSKRIYVGKITGGHKRKRAPEKVAMDKFNRPKVFREKRRLLEALDADQELRDFLFFNDDDEDYTNG